MKRMIRFAIVLSIPIILIGCGKDESNPTAPTISTVTIGKATIDELFKAGMSAYSNSQSGESQLGKSQPENPSDLINISVDCIFPGPEGGNIHVIGTITGSWNFDQYYNFLGGTLLIGFTETINDFAFKCDGQKYTTNGAPYVSAAGTFTINPDYTFGTASSMVIGGGVRSVGPNYDKTNNIQITININSSGTGGDVSGTFGGQAMNFTL